MTIERLNKYAPLEAAERRQHQTGAVYKRKFMSIAKKGNIGKHDTYALAFAMIDEALDAQCPLQAIAIEESILTDRLWSTLNADRERADDSEFKCQNLGAALVMLKNAVECKANCCSRFDAEIKSLYAELDSWRLMRNRLLHSIVKSRQGESPDVPAGEFREYAQYAAKVGLRLARTISNWTQKSIKHSRHSK